MSNLIFSWKRFAMTVAILIPLLTTQGLVEANAAVQDGGQVTVSGFVRDSEGKPVTGASITVQGTYRGVTSGADGSYTIQATRTSTLVFSFIGMQPVEEEVNNRTTINVVLQYDALDITDVVVIGYGTQSRSTLTTSISKMAGDDLAIVPSGSPLVMMQGKIPGVDIRVTSGQPGAAPDVIIRGGTTTNPTGDTPLYIVDGVIRPNMRDINYNDIASIEVLKDAASTAVYGSRASNGIVIITTKTGKPGEGKINFSYGLTVDKQAKRHPMSNAREYLTATRTAALHARNPDAYLTTGTYGMTTSNERNTIITTAFLDNYIRNYGQEYVDDLLYNKGWQIMEDPANPGKMLIFQDNDFQSGLFQTAINHEYNLSMSGGNDRATYYASAGYIDQKGIVYGTNYKRWNAMINSSYKIRNNLTARAVFDYAQRKTTGVTNENNAMSRAAKMPPTMRMYYEDGTPAPGELRNDFRSRLHEIYYQSKYNQVGRFNMSMELDWEIIEDLHFIPTFSFYNNEGINHSFERANEIYGDRRASAEHENNRQYQAEAVLTYHKTLWEKHNFDFTGGASYITTTGFLMTGSGDGGSSDYIETLNGTAPDNQKVSTKASEKRTASLFGRVNYNYDRRYLFSASIRYDGSSHFAENNKYGVFPGVSAGWNMHYEDFWTNMKPYVNNAKLRLSWGKAGNDKLNYANSNGAYSAGYNYMGESGILYSTLANRDLLWEETTSIDAGLDLGFLNNRIGLMLDLYRKKTNNRLIDQNLWAESGFKSIKANYGSLLTHGIEIQVDATPVRLRDFTWDISANFSYFKTVVDKLPDNGAERNRIGGGVVYDEKLGKYIEVAGLAEGERPYAIYGYKMDGVYATDADAAKAPYDTQVSAYWLTHVNHEYQKQGGDAIWRDLDGNGIIDEKDVVLLGYENPDKFFSFVNTFRYKRLSLRFAIDGAMGHIIGNHFRSEANANARNNYATIHDVAGNKIWKKQGDIASIPRYDVESDWDNGKRNHNRPTPPGVGKSGLSNSFYVKKGDYLAFREISLTYSLQPQWLKNIGVPSIDLTAGVYNLGYITQYDGLTPEVYGVDSGKYPRPRSFIFSVNFSF